VDPLPPASTSRPARAGEAVAVAVVAGIAAWSYGAAVVSPAVGVAAGIVGAANGAISGWRRIYAWRRRTGWWAALLDSTWGLPPVLLGLVAHVVAGLRHGGYEASLSRRLNRHVYRRGAHLQAGYVFTIGNVISSAGDVDQPRRRKLIVDHEDVHVWQARWWGPAYLVLYLGWNVAGFAAGTIAWLRHGRREPFGKVVRSWTYYSNPFEWWAYCRDDLWPPSGLVHGVGWRRRVVRPFPAARTQAHLGIHPGVQVDDRPRP